MITVYTQDNCSRCDVTKLALKRAGKDFEEVQLTDELRDQFKSEGLMQAPIVDIDGEKHTGFRPDKLQLR